MNKLIITNIKAELKNNKLPEMGNENNKIIFAIFKDNTLENFEIYNPKNSLLNSVHAAKVKNIVKNINAAFLEIKDTYFKNILVYYSLEANKEHIFLNVKKDNIIHEGDDILIQIKKEALKTKQAQASSHIILKDANFEEILNKAKYIKSPAPVYMDTYIFKDFLNRNLQLIDEIVCEIPEIYEQLKCFMDAEYENKVPVRLYEDKLISLSKLYSVNIRINELLQKHIYLKSGAYLVIENTEALNVIDVNTGKTDIKKSKNETIKITNIEAAKECIRQIRLRNLYGIILIDFIDMKDYESRGEVLDILKEGLKKDAVKTKVLGFTKLGLVEISRQKRKRSLKEELYS